MSLESRVELILQNILGASNEVDPESRVEKLLQNLIEVAYIVDPMSRVELLLENLQGGSNEVVPMSRVEMLIANALGATYEVVPQSRVEELLVLLAEEYATVYKTVTGAIVTFDDAVPNEPFRQLVVDINPIQDLHGQDSPYPAGGGKNKLHIDDFSATTKNGVTFSCVDGVITANGTATADTIFVISPYGGTYTTIDNIFDVEADTTYVMSGSINGSCNTTWWLQLLISGSGAEPHSAYGDSATFSFTAEEIASQQRQLAIRFKNGTAFNNVKFYPMIRLSSVTDSTFAPYSNICPISGWTSVHPNISGINVWDEELEDGYIDTYTGEFRSNTSNVRTKTLFSVVPSVDYFICAEGMTESKRFGYCFYNKDGGYVSGTIVAVNNTVHVPSNAHYMAFFLPKSWYTGQNVSINYPSTDHDYHPYTGRSITIDLGQTVYGGKLDVLSGELVVDRAMVTFDGTENYQNAYFPTVVCTKNIGDSGDYSRRAEIFSNYCSAPNVGFGMSTATTIQWKYVDQNFGVSSADELKALFAQYYADGNPMTVVYPLATPITIQLTPNQLNSLYGVNNIWADSGDTEVEYRADTKLYINRLTEPDTDMIADANLCPNLI